VQQTGTPPSVTPEAAIMLHRSPAISALCRIDVFLTADVSATGVQRSLATIDMLSVSIITNGSAEYVTTINIWKGTSMNGGTVPFIFAGIQRGGSLARISKVQKACTLNQI
jgi:uncharacterized membrane protein